ncbi:ScbA/BarX family gamma-butyrolactone biosynthesis protein [Streptomyces sp. NPDC018964]|uniref:ScbA/BarX family gamma-butyrolactone biosynthesis protein n=1 Tax=Streptomyces sp. NPDC018964 TaxID=3365058 RepID=UPI00379A3C7D
MSTSTFRVEDVPGVAETAVRLAKPLFTGDLSHYPTLTTTVPKEFVHRAAVAEVMLTGWEDKGDRGGRGDRRFEVTAQWPRSHSFFTPTPDNRHDPLIVAETIRQAGLLLSHAELGVPLAHRFLMGDLSFTAQPSGLLVGDAPAAVSMDVVCKDIKWRGSIPSEVRFETVIRRDGRIIATGSAFCTYTSPAVYRRLRGNGLVAAQRPLPLTAPVPPQNVGRMSPMDVVLSPLNELDCWQLRVNTRHPVLFDHPVDHVPGMLLLEAARQAAAAFLGGDCLPVGMTSEFTRFAELDEPCLIQICVLPGTADGREHLLVTGRQRGETVFTSTVVAAA